MRRKMLTLVGALALAVSLDGRAAEMTAPVEVAPKAQGTRTQVWVSAAWNSGAKCWLVAWREGFLNEPESQIHCGRVSVDGKALDPAGIILTTGKGLKDLPAVASDGKDFLVLWQDMGNGKDWDVRGARVTGDGKASEPVTVAGGEDNQCWPAIGFAKGNYIAVWQGWVNGGYGVYCARVSPDGKVLDAKPAEVAGFAQRPLYQAILPAVSSRGDELLVAGYYRPIGNMNGYIFGRFVDAATGQPQGPPPPAIGHNDKLAAGPVVKFSVETQSTAVALGKKGSRLIAVCWGEWGVTAFRVYLIADDGKELSKGCFVWGGKQGFTVLNSKVAFDGSQYLVVADFSEGGGGNSATTVYGWKVGDDCKFELAGRFAIAEGQAGGRNQVCPTVAAGPAGACLVAWSDVRGVDDVKVMARVVK